MANAIRYDKPITVKFPEDVVNAMQKRIEKKQTKFPRYSEADLIRTSVVKHLKEKGILDKGKNYL